MLAISVVVFGAIRLGLQTETRAIIADELVSPSGIIFNAVHHCVDEHIEPIVGNMVDIEKQMIIATTVQREIRSDIREIKETVKEIHKNGS